MTELRHSYDLPYHPDTVERLVLGILSLCNSICSLKSLEPDQGSHKLFNQLFDLVTTTKTTKAENDQVLGDARISSILPTMWRTWGEAEYCLERDFARKVIRGADPLKCNELFESFPYLDQYRQLARMEANTIDTAIGELQLPPVRKIACVGSGPTPFTSICLQERYGTHAEFVNVDRNPEAIQLGSEVVKSCGIDRISPLLMDAASLSGLEKLDLVHFAAMVGQDPEEKIEILLKVAARMRQGALILIRSVDALRQVLYPAFDLDDRRVLAVVTPVVATRYFGQATSLTVIVVRVD